jgi:hypothetical protein
MDRDRLLAVVVAVVSVAAIGMAATTLESSVRTTPDDAIDLRGDALPIGSDELARYKQRIQSGGGGSNPGAGTDTTSAPGGEGKSAPQEVSEASDQGSPDTAQVETETRGPGPDDVQYEQTLLQWLLGLLQWLLGLLLRFLPVVAALAALAALYSNRDRLRTLVAGLRDRRGGDDAADGPALRPAPRNDVARAFHEMVSLLGIDRPETKTPRECASAATAAGVDREAAEEVTRSFEAVRYGPAEVTDERRERVREALRRIRSQREGAT